MKRRLYHRSRPPEPAVEPATSAFQRILTNSAIILAVTTGLLYFHGRSLYQGYYGYWGLDFDLFPISTEDALFHGVYAYIWLGVEKWPYFLLLALGIAGQYLLVFLLCFNRPLAFIRKTINSDVFNRNQRRALDGFFTIVYRLLDIFLIILVFILITHFASQKGAETAKAHHEKIMADKEISKNKFEKVLIIFQDESGQGHTIAGYRIATSANLCALFTHDGVQVVPFSRIISMQLPSK